MTKIFKHLAKHWAACLVIIALLLVQAYGDLTLPDYTSKIVDTGIQQGGIESPLPQTLRSSTRDALSLLSRGGEISSRLRACPTLSGHQGAQKCKALFVQFGWYRGTEHVLEHRQAVPCLQHHGAA